MLFAGASGTVKTMAAEVLANELTLGLYRVDPSKVLSEYLGEMERNLRRVFDAAESSGEIVLFDEGDALLGKSAEVRDSHDRYANIEVSYLLERMEAYRSLGILTTNLKEALYAAFLAGRETRLPLRAPADREQREADEHRPKHPESNVKRVPRGVEWMLLASSAIEREAVLQFGLVRDLRE